MGLEREIEKVFQRAMAADLELIAQNVSAQNSTYTTPLGSCMCACSIAAMVSRSPGERPEEQLYSIMEMSIRPEDFWKIVRQRIQEAGEPQVAAHSSAGHFDSLESLLQQRAEAEGDSKIALENQITSLISVMAEHYRDEGPSVNIVVRANGKVATLGVIDYVHEDCSGDALKELVSNTELHIPSIGSLTRWPENLLIYSKDDFLKKREPDRFIRADLKEGVVKAHKRRKKVAAPTAPEPAGREKHGSEHMRPEDLITTLEQTKMSIEKRRRPKPVVAPVNTSRVGTSPDPIAEEDARRHGSAMLRRALNKKALSGPGVRELEIAIGQVILQHSKVSIAEKLLNLN